MMAMIILMIMIMFNEYIGDKNSSNWGTIYDLPSVMMMMKSMKS